MELPCDATDEFIGLSSDELKALLRAKDAELILTKAELRSNILLLQAMKLQIAKLKQMQFGQRSEKRARQIAQLELGIEELETFEAKIVDENAEPYTVLQAEPQENATTARLPKQRREFPAHLPRETRIIEPAICMCLACGGKLSILGEDVCEYLELEPLRFKVIRQVRPKFACTGCDAIVQEAAPSRPIERGMVGPGLLAHVLVGKYADHKPLYRQAEIYAREGVHLERSLLAQWVGGASKLLTPLVDALRAHVFSAEVVHADDTPLPVLAPGLGKTKTGRLWTYVRDERPAAGTIAPAVWFAYSPDRKGEHPQNHLETFSGVLQADGYAGYIKLYKSGSITEASCWAHARRKFFDLHAANQSPIAAEALDCIGALYDIEKEIRGKPSIARCSERRMRSRPLLDAMHAWLQQTLPTVSQKSAMAQAMRYSLDRWESLTRYCDDGRIEIDNNAAERSLRCVALGRKNFLFAGSDNGGDYAAGIYSLIGTAKLNGYNPEAFLREVLTRISDHPISKIIDLLPWNIPSLESTDREAITSAA
jgi:transposase